MYTPDLALRNRFRSEEAHACISVEGLPLAEPDGPFSWRRRVPTPRAASWDAGAVWLCEVVYVRGDGDRAVHHRRQVALVRGRGVVVCDWLTGGGVHELRWHWPLPVRLDAVALSNSGASLHGVAIEWFGVGRSMRPTAELASRPFAPSYGQLSPGSMLTVRCATELPAVLVTSFGAVSDAGRAVAADQRQVLLTLQLPDGTHELEFRANDRPIVRRTRSREPSQARPLPLSAV